MLGQLYARKGQYQSLQSQVQTVLNHHQTKNCLDALEAKENALSSVLGAISSKISEIDRLIREEEERLERERQERLEVGF